MSLVLLSAIIVVRQRVCGRLRFLSVCLSVDSLRKIAIAIVASHVAYTGYSAVIYQSSQSFYSNEH